MNTAAVNTKNDTRNSKADTHKKPRAPGPRGNPIMGNLADYKRDPIGMLLRLQQNHGDVVRNQLGPFLTHAIAHPDHVQHILQDNQRNYCRGRFYENFKLFFGDGLLTTDGDFWLRHRRTVQPLFHKKEVFSQTDCVAEAAMALVESWRQLPANQAVDVVDDMMALSLNILGQMVFNVDISRHAKTVGPAVRFGLQAMMPQGNLNDFIPRWLPTPFNRRIAQARKGIDQIIGQIIEDHRHGKSATSDIISLMLDSRHPTTGEPMTEQEVHDEVMTVFLAGHETTGSGLAWGLYALSQHPMVLRKLRDELDAQLGGRAPTQADMANLPYLDQVVSEVLRVYPPIWGFTRDLINDDEIGGYHIPAGSSVFVSPYVTHRHPEFWSNPDAFDPENFGPSADKLHKFAYFPFGGGMRKCIGFQTALLQMRVILAMVAQHFDLSALPGHPIVRGALISLRPLDGVRLFIKPRADKPKVPVAKMTENMSVEPAVQTSPVAADRVEPAVTATIPTAGQCPFSAARAMAAEASAPIKEPAKTESAISNKLDLAKPVSPSEPSATVPVRRFTWFAAEIENLPSTAAPELAGKRIVIVNGRSSTAERVASCLARACAKSVIFSPAEATDPTAAANALVLEHGPFDGIVDLSLETPFQLDQANAWQVPMACSVAMLKACYDHWLQETQTNRLFYLAVTWLDGRMGYGREDHKPALQPLGGLWSGLAKTLPQELPNCNVRVLDLGPDEAGHLERHLIAELYRWGLFEVGYHQGRRYTLQAKRDELPTTHDIALKAGDTVLFSGGARGIGLLCARALASRYGARVVITGRQPVPDDSEPWLHLDEAGFKAFAQNQLRQATATRLPGKIMKEMAQLQQRRELKASLDELAASGLAVEYRVCDVTDFESVRALCDELGDGLKLVIHNAGVDQPVRLPAKTFANFSATVRTKVLGFSHLCRALEQREGLVQFCNVGSLTGRWGGMTGETDYAAANEALARLGLWAAQDNRLSCPVKTLVWPTWEGVGMITNFAVTQRYVTPMALHDGIDHWLRELADPSSAEVMFMGAVGRALTPIQIKGFSPIMGLPNIQQLITRHHHSGYPLEFRPFARLLTRYPLDARVAPFLRGWRLQGLPALPIAMALEHACALGDWVVPEGFKEVKLDAMINIQVSLPNLILSGYTGAHSSNSSSSTGELSVELESEAMGYWLGADWHVDVRLIHAHRRDEMLRLTLVYRTEVAARASLAEWPLSSGAVRDLPLATPASWNGQLLRNAEWQQASTSGLWFGRVSPADAADLWALPYPPELRLPINAIENALRCVWANRQGVNVNPADSSVMDQGLTIDQLQLSPNADQATWVVQQGLGEFALCNDEGLIVAHMAGSSLFTSAELTTVDASANPASTSRPSTSIEPAATAAREIPC